MGAGIGHRVERALHHRQQRDFGRHAALLELVDDVIEVYPAAIEDALQVLGPRRVVIGLLAHEAVVRVGDLESLPHALPQILRRRRAVDDGDRLARLHGRALALERGQRSQLRRGRGLRRGRRGSRYGLLGLRLRCGLVVRRRGLATGWVGAAGNDQRSEEGEKPQNLFFQSRIAANTRTGSATRAPRYLLADSTTAGSRQRRNGLVAFSSASVLGTVGLPASRKRWSRAWRALSAWLFGSTACAKPMFASVYSCPQYTFVSSGSAASFESDAYICSAVPSNRRPQPHAKSVSPQKRAPAP